MNITISNKQIIAKPTDFNEFQKDLVFTTVNCSADDFKTIIDNGFTLTFNYKDKSFTYKGYKKKENYKSTQFICVDIDECKFTAEQIMEKMMYKPSFYQTSFSHKTEKKGFLNCYHFYYILSEEVFGEYNYGILYNAFITGVSDLVDPRAKDCHRIFYTSNKNNQNYESQAFGNIYNPSDFIQKEIVPSFQDFVSGKVEAKKKQQKAKVVSLGKSESTLNNEWNLNENFFKDMNTLMRSELVQKYFMIYPFYRESVVMPDPNKSYIDLTGMDYFEVDNKTKWDAEQNKSVKVKVKIGNRHNQLFIDAIQLKACYPNITIEGLVLGLINEVLQYYDNSDKEMNNRTIIGTAMKVYNDSSLTARKSNKKFKVNKNYFIDNNILCSQQKRVGLARRDKKDDEILECLDLGLTVENNIKELGNVGIKVTKKRLIDLITRYNIDIKTEKQVRDEKVLNIYKNNIGKSLRDLEKICKSQGISISYRTIDRLIKSEKSDILKNETCF